MKALLIKQSVYEGAIAAIHGMSHTIYRIVVPSANNLCINIFGGQLYAFTGFELEAGEYELIREIEVQDELIQKVNDYLLAKKAFDELKKEFELILSEPRSKGNEPNV
jgi:hypothetical protein